MTQLTQLTQSTDFWLGKACFKLPCSGIDRYTAKNQEVFEDRATQQCAKKHAKLIR
jgi:hypothetical protein